MPASYSHYRLGKIVLKHLDDQLKKIINDKLYRIITTLEMSLE